MCLLAPVMASLDLNIVTVAQRTFAVAFHCSQAAVAWTMAGYMLALAAVVPMTGWAADRFGTKRLFIGSIVMFTLGSLLCATAPNILLLIVFRAVQGMGGGMLVPLMTTIITREAGPRRLGRLMALGAIPMLLAPVCGPVLGGWLITTHSWKWLFLINLPVGLTAFVLAAILLPRDQPAPSERFDFIGMLLLSPGVAMLLLGLSSIPARGNVADHRVWVPATVGLVLIAAFVIHSRYRGDHALIDLRLFTNRVVSLACLALLVYVAGSVGASLLLPIYFQQLLHQTPMQSGLHTIPLALGAMLSLPIAGAFMDKRGPGNIVPIGVALVVAGMGTFAYGVAKQADYLPTLLIGLLVTGMGVGCTAPPLGASALQALAQHQIARGSTLLSVNQNISGAVGIALMSVILTNQFNRSENISVANKMAILQDNAHSRGLPVDSSAIPQRSLAPDFMANLHYDLWHAYTVVFIMAAVLVVLTLIPVAFLPRKQVSASPENDS